jgi:hypothetical protein
MLWAEGLLGILWSIFHKAKHLQQAARSSLAMCL